MAIGTQSQSDVDIDLMRLVAAIWERRLAVLATVLAVGLLAFIVASAISPLYRAETRILIEEREVVTRSDAAARDVVLDQQAILSQVEVIRSSDLLRRVIDELDLRSRPEFDPAAQPSMLTRVRVLLGLASDPHELSSTNRVLRAFREKLQVYPVQNSRVIAIEFSSEDPELAADVANALAAAYLEVQSDAKLASNSAAAAWLEPEIEAMRERVREAEGRVAAYRSDSDLFLVAQNDSLSARQLSDISTELSRLRAERADAEARAANVRQALEEGRSTDTISSVLESSLIQRLREREVALQSEIADLSTTLLDNHPRIRGLRSQLSDLERQTRSEVQKALASLESDAAVARLREQELTAQLDTLKATSAQAGEEEVGLRALEREATAERELLESYLARYREALSRGDANALPADARVISRALPPSEHYYPRKLAIVTVAMLATLLIHAIAIMLAELFSGRALRRSDDVAPIDAGSPLPPLAAMETNGHAEGMMRPQEHGASVPEAAGPEAPIDPALLQALDATAAREAEAREAAASAETASFAAAASRPTSISAADGSEADDADDDEDEEDFSPNAVAEGLAARRVETVVCLSPEGESGSRGAVQLARSIAARGERVLLIDMTGSGAPTKLMAESAQLPGVTNLLCNEVSIAEAIHADRASQADIVPLGTTEPARAMRAASRLRMIIEALANAYDRVIVECGDTRIENVASIIGEFAVVLSIVEPATDLVTEELTALIEAGHDDVLLLLVDPLDGDGHGKAGHAA